MSVFNLVVGKARKVKRFGITRRLRTVKGVTLQILELSAIYSMIQISETEVCKLIRTRRVHMVFNRELIAYISCCFHVVLKPYWTFLIFDCAMASEITLQKSERYKDENFISELAATRAASSLAEISTIQISSQVTLWIIMFIKWYSRRLSKSVHRACNVAQ